MLAVINAWLMLSETARDAIAQVVADDVQDPEESSGVLADIADEEAVAS